MSEIVFLVYTPFGKGRYFGIVFFCWENEGDQMNIVNKKIGELKPYENNPRHNENAVPYVVESIKRYGFKNPIIIDKDNVIVAGHTRYLASKELGLNEVPCIVADDLTEDEIKEFRLVDNRTAEMSEWDDELLASELEDIDFGDFDFGFGDDEIDPYDNSGDVGSLQRDFIAPPFSILDGRQGYWVERKRYWREKIQDEAQARDVKAISHNFKRGGGASILDPALSEIILKWFTPHDGSKVFDTFAGDTVFGYVAGSLGHDFTGIELRKEQADFNNERTLELPAHYINDDGRNVCKHIKESSQDLYFSCPPYYDLEIYSNDPSDASNQETYEEFYQILDEAFTNGIKCLADNRFAVVVVGNIRDNKTGGYYDFMGDVIRTFTRNGMLFYNDMILIDPVGSAGIRARKQMEYRKVVKVHQNVLVFYKGDQKNIQDIFPKIEVRIDESQDEQVEWLDN